MAFSDLLPSRTLVSLTTLTHAGSSNFAQGGIVEGEVPVFPETEGAEIRGMSSQEGLVCEAIGLGARAGDGEKGFRAYPPSTRCLRRKRGKLAGWEESMPTYSSMWNTFIADQRSSFVSLRAARGSSSWEFPVDDDVRLAPLADRHRDRRRGLDGGRPLRVPR